MRVKSVGDIIRQFKVGMRVRVIFMCLLIHNVPLHQASIVGLLNDFDYDIETLVHVSDKHREEPGERMLGHPPKGSWGSKYTKHKRKSDNLESS
ncbi:hypothetical protein Scep_025803 [Stephania cephalantha]|uniref:Uncharacterized protein n=1 Tax=Stephania cephalantha TaxID=152367 RepID=A0AAP0HPP4_9MAGN